MFGRSSPSVCVIDVPTDRTLATSRYRKSIINSCGPASIMGALQQDYASPPLTRVVAPSASSAAYRVHQRTVEEGRPLPTKLHNLIHPPLILANHEICSNPPTCRKESFVRTESTLTLLPAGSAHMAARIRQATSPAAFGLVLTAHGGC